MYQYLLFKKIIYIQFIGIIEIYNKMSYYINIT